MGQALYDTILTGSVRRPLAAVQRVDLSKFAKTWYCVAASANWLNGVRDVSLKCELEYPTSGAYYKITNSGRDASGKLIYTQGRLVPDLAYTSVEHDTVPGQMVVRLVPNMTNPSVGTCPTSLWIIMLAPDYRYMVFADPSRSELCIMSASRSIAFEDLKCIYAELTTTHDFPKGFVANLRRDTGTQISAPRN